MPITPEKFLARKLDVDEGEAFIENTPLGVLFCIEPWNFPYYQLARVVGRTSWRANTLVVKHAPNVPQCALAFEKLFSRCWCAGGCLYKCFYLERAICCRDRG